MHDMKRTVLVLALAVAVLTAVPGCSQSPKSMDSLTVASLPLESLGLVYVAQQRDMFAENGVKVTFREYDTGVAALQAVIDGEADVAAGTSEFPLVKHAFDQVAVSAIATIDRPDFIYLIGRKDHGIHMGRDLKGKRVGTTAGSIAQFYLGRFLELNGMTPSDITFVDLKTPDEWRTAIADGAVDAVVLAQPEASVVKDRLGDNATFLSIQWSQPAYTLAIAQNEWIAENSRCVERFLAALSDAEEYVAAHPVEARSIIQKRLKLDADYMDLVWTQNTFSLSLDQSLIVAMEDEARWMIRNDVTTGTVVPDFADYVYVTGLDEVKPDAVNILD